MKRAANPTPNLEGVQRRIRPPGAMTDDETERMLASELADLSKTSRLLEAKKGARLIQYLENNPDAAVGVATDRQAQTLAGVLGAHPRLVAPFVCALGARFTPAGANALAAAIRSCPGFIGKFEVYTSTEDPPERSCVPIILRALSSVPNLVLRPRVIVYPDADHNAAIDAYLDVFSDLPHTLIQLRLDIRSIEGSNCWPVLLEPGRLAQLPSLSLQFDDEPEDHDRLLAQVAGLIGQCSRLHSLDLTSPESEVPWSTELGNAIAASTVKELTIIGPVFPEGALALVEDERCQIRRLSLDALARGASWEEDSNDLAEFTHCLMRALSTEKLSAFSCSFPTDLSLLGKALRANTRLSELALCGVLLPEADFGAFLDELTGNQSLLSIRIEQPWAELPPGWRALTPDEASRAAGIGQRNAVRFDVGGAAGVGFVSGLPFHPAAFAAVAEIGQHVGDYLDPLSAVSLSLTSKAAYAAATPVRLQRAAEFDVSYGLDQAATGSPPSKDWFVRISAAPDWPQMVSSAAMKSCLRFLPAFLEAGVPFASVVRVLALALDRKDTSPEHVVAALRDSRYPWADIAPFMCEVISRVPMGALATIPGPMLRQLFTTMHESGVPIQTVVAALSGLVNNAVVMALLRSQYPRSPGYVPPASIQAQAELQLALNAAYDI